MNHAGLITVIKRSLRLPASLPKCPNTATRSTMQWPPRCTRELHPLPHFKPGWQQEGMHLDRAWEGMEPCQAQTCLPWRLCNLWRDVPPVVRQSRCRAQPVVPLDLQVCRQPAAKDAAVVLLI
jgi:hypothetical protein